jgi:hypothetical protein
VAVCGLDQKIKIMDTNTKKIIYDQDQNFEISSITFLKDKNGEKIIFTIDNMPKCLEDDIVTNLTHMK